MTASALLIECLISLNFFCSCAISSCGMVLALLGHDGFKSLEKADCCA
jgi:hypothetical protein